MNKTAQWVLPIYAVLSLTAMAWMNLSFLAVFLSLMGVLILQWRQKQTAHFILSSSPHGFTPPPEYRSYQLWSWILFAACSLSLVVAWIDPLTYAGTEPDVTVHGFLKIWYLLIPPVLVHWVMRTQADPNAITALLERTVRAWLWMLLVMGVVAVIQFNTGWPLRQAIPTNPGHFHAILLFGHHLSTASIIPFPTFCALAIALGAYTRTRHWPRFELTAGLVGLLILFLSYARTAWLTFPIGIAVLFARYLTRRQFWVSFGSFALAGIGLCFTPMMRERIVNQMGISERLTLWKVNIDYFLHRPLTGVGWLKTQEMSEFYFKEHDPAHYRDYFWGHAHSNFFEMLGGTGLLGLFAFLAWSWFTLRLAFLNSRRAEASGRVWLADLSWGIFVGLLLLHLNGLTNVTFWEGKVMHQQMLGVGLLLVIRFIL